MSMNDLLCKNDLAWLKACGQDHDVVLASGSGWPETFVSSPSPTARISVSCPKCWLKWTVSFQKYRRPSDRRLIVRIWSALLRFSAKC